ncbi:MAG TPA: zf-HC2 domain-containing protein [Polyangia bacterium]
MSPEPTTDRCEEIQPLVRDATRGRLHGEEAAHVAAHLLTCAACRALADEERELDRRLDELPQRPASLALKRRLAARLPDAAARTRRRVSRGTMVAASLAAAACVALAAVALHGRFAAPATNPLVAEAVADHLRVVYREHPIDIESGGPHQVKPWFTGRLDFALPSVFGGDGDFTLTGGSVGWYVDRKAAVLVYKHLLHTISLFVFRADGLSFPRADRDLGRVAARVERRHGFSVIVWRDGDLGYALVSDLNQDDLQLLARRIAASP